MRYDTTINGTEYQWAGMETPGGYVAIDGGQYYDNAWHHFPRIEVWVQPGETAAEVFNNWCAKFVATARFNLVQRAQSDKMRRN